jgi:hypothetical protein
MSASLSLEQFQGLVEAALPFRENDTVQKWSDIKGELIQVFQGSNPWRTTQFIKRALVTRRVFQGNDLIPYYGIASSIGDACRGLDGTEPSQEQWRQAIKLLVHCGARLHTVNLSESTALQLHQREHAVAAAYKQLDDMGYAVRLTDDVLEMSTQQSEKLHQNIEQHVKDYGGKNLVHSVFAVLTKSNLYASDCNRWILTRNSPDYSEDTPQPQVPWGYILQLGFKHFQVKGAAHTHSFVSVIKLVSLAVATLDVQPYTSSAVLSFMDSERLIPFLLNETLYDSVLTFEQFPAHDASALLEYLAKNETTQPSDHPGVPLRSLMSVAIALLKGILDTSPIHLRARDLAKYLGRSQHNVRLALDQVLAYEVVNPVLGFPPLSTQINSVDRPLIKLKDGDYWCPPQSLCGKATLDAVFQAMRERDKHSDDRLGEHLEQFLIHQMRQAGLTVQYGKYKVMRERAKALDGECDIAIESSAYIVLVEIKKKVLTRIGRSGHDLSLLLDLTQSLAKSQAQLIRHEALLRQFGTLRLISPNRPPHDLELAGRRVLRASVVLFDYGCLHDRLTLAQFLRIGCDCSFTTSYSKYEEKIYEINNTFQALRAQAIAVDEFQENHPFARSMLLSIPQIMLLLRYSKSNESFVEELRRGESTHSTAKDFYHHFKFFRSSV